MTLTPVDLFKDDGARFEPFLGPMSGAFKLRYQGDKPNAILSMDIWKEGKKIASAGSIHDLFFSADEQAKHEIEVIISIETDSIEGKDNATKIKVSTLNDSGSDHSTFTIPSDKGLTSRSLISNKQPRSFTTDEPVHVWGMQATSTSAILSADLSLESLSRLEWAIIFTLSFED